MVQKYVFFYTICASRIIPVLRPKNPTQNFKYEKISHLHEWQKICTPGNTYSARVFTRLIFRNNTLAIIGFLSGCHWFLIGLSQFFGKTFSSSCNFRVSPEGK